MEKNIFGFVDISHRRYKLRRDVEQTPFSHAHERSSCDMCCIQWNPLPLKPLHAYTIPKKTTSLQHILIPRCEGYNILKA
jgi:hypothetical protein